MPDNPTDIESFPDHVRGEIFQPGDTGYDDARAVWNGLIDRESNIVWTTELHEALHPYGNGGEYINNQTEDDEQRVRAAYGDHYERLQAIKNEWDPGNLFRVNHTIEPTE